MGNGDLDADATSADGGATWNFTFGRFNHELARTINVGTIPSGPNQGYVFANGSLDMPQSTVNINDAFNGVGPFYARQTGTFMGTTTNPNTGRPWCTAAAFTPLRAETERHEGLTGAANSHFGIWNANLAASSVRMQAEQLVMAGVSSAQFATAVGNLLGQLIAQTINPVNQAFDDLERPLIPQWSGNCDFVYQH